MTKKKNMKKMLNVLTAKAIIVSSISGAVLTPSLSALAAEGQSVVGVASTDTQASTLLNLNWELDSTNKLKYWTSQGSVPIPSSNTEKYTKTGNVLSIADGTRSITINDENSFTLTSTSLTHGITQNVPTEIGKEYTVSTYVKQFGTPYEAESAQLLINDTVNKITTNNQLVSYTFKATSTSTRIGFINRKIGVGLREVAFSNIYVGKSQEQTTEDNKVINARTAVNNLFENQNPNGKIREDLTQAELDATQKLLFLIGPLADRQPISDDFKKAQAQLNERNAQSKTELEVATNAVKELFNNNDTTGTIKDNTTQEAINTAKELVAAITDADKKAELEAQLTEAQKQLDAKTAETAAEQARQETATNAVKELFNNNDTTGTIKDNTTQEAINNAKELVAAITDADKKAELEAQLTEAQKQVDAKTAENEAEQARQETATNAVKELFNNNDTTGTIKDNTTQEAINTAKELVAAITDTDKKAELEKAITEAQKQLTEKETKVEVTGKANPFILHQDRYLSGTYTGDITAISVDVNGKRYYGGTVKDGEFSFYALDKIANLGDVVTINLHGADKTIQKSITVQVKEADKVTQAAYSVKDSNITGTFNNPDITKMNIVVNGTTYWGGTLTNGTFKFYALDKIKSATDEVSMNFYNANNELILSKNLTITAPVVTSGEITSATVAVGDKNIVGTITGDIKSLGVTIDGVTYNGGTIAADGTFKFYVADKKFTAESNITIVGYDKSKNTLSEMSIVVSK
ncbi:toxin Cry1Ac domain D-VI-related protein [Listeria booriae]|uniref:immunoglobulin-like domain-containing protein n=1 Tax=Listeria booriae TaxID=1552123 RepID=UPI0028805742|nr:immunoglobulin-like domain-containing protein [Listeria booriae]MDT0111353.1 toxin Cry1Ac domain D-VI-related protein [Listeria booriae]